MSQKDPCSPSILYFSMKLKVIGENLGSYLNAIALDVRKSSWKMEYRKLIVSQPSRTERSQNQPGSTKNQRGTNCYRIS